MTARDEFVKALDECLEEERLRAEFLGGSPASVKRKRARVLAAYDAYDAAHPAKAEAGWVMVPREPTEAMLKAIPSYDRNSTVGIAVWRAMLAAAPPAPGAEKDAAMWKYVRDNCVVGIGMRDYHEPGDIEAAVYAAMSGKGAEG